MRHISPIIPILKNNFCQLFIINYGKLTVLVQAVFHELANVVNANLAETNRQAQNIVLMCMMSVYQFVKLWYGKMWSHDRTHQPHCCNYL
jgi:hypothetical protein